MYGTVHSASSSSKATSVAAVCGCAAVFAVAGFVAAQPSTLYAPVAVRPAVQASMASIPVARVARPSMVSAAQVAQVQGVESNVFAQMTSTFAPIALGVGALAAVAAALFQKSQPVAMAATSGRPVWFPNATPPAHLTGQYPGDRGFDPLGFSKDPKTFERMRISEVFHGRLAMLGIVGCVVPEWLFQQGAWFDLSGFDVDRIGVAALQVIAPIEYWRGNGGFSWNGGDVKDRSYPGFDPLGLTTEDTKLKEIKNGRLAMIGMLGLEVQNHTTGKSPLANLAAHLANPVGANILTGGGVAMFSTAGQKTDRPLWFPGGYAPSYLTGKYPADRGFDPAGLAADPKVFERMRISEVFHGRLAMLAIVGAVVPEYLGRGAWYEAAGNAGIGYTEVATFVAAFGLPEVFRGLQKEELKASYPGFDPLNLTTDYTKEAEIKNGRLAMIAMAGLEAQHHVTGQSPVVNFVEHFKGPLGHNIANSLITNTWPVAMMATSGHKDGLWFPGAKAPAHLTGEFPGDRGFDPLSLAVDPTVYARMRVSEVFHGRLAMLGMVGSVVPEILGKGAWFQAGEAVDGVKFGFILMAIAAPVEYWRSQGGFGWDKDSKADRSYPGFDPAKLTTERNKVAEIKNGRLAMAGLLGLAAQYVATGESPLANLAAHLANPVGANITTTFA